MQLDYNQLLDNIKRRRFDEAIRDHVLAPSFFDENLAQPVRYTLESMAEVDPAYAYKVYANTRRINETIDKELKQKGIRAVVRYQGALRTDTHIRLYGEVDMLCVLDNTADHKAVFSLGQIIRDCTARMNVQNADYSDGTRIRVVTQKPVCRINIIPCSWINNPQYLSRKNEIYRGIAVYNFKDKTRKKHLPFLNMARINLKDQETSGAYKSVIRLLKSLCTDESISLTTYELASLVYHIPNDELVTSEDKQMKSLLAAWTYMNNLLQDKDEFELLLSPSEKELIFGKRSDKIEAVQKLFNALNTLTDDLKQHAGENLDTSFDYHSESTGNSDSE